MTMYSFFAEILEYPRRSVIEPVEECLAKLAQDAETRGHLAEFRNAMARKTLGQMQEDYTNAFDLRPECTPNLGYHLFGDDARRGLFLAELKGRMNTCGISTGLELPDHISLILTYLDLVEAERPALIEDCLLTSVSRMAEVLAGNENPYEHTLHALLCFLRRQHELFPVTAVEAETVIA